MAPPPTKGKKRSADDASRPAAKKSKSSSSSAPAPAAAAAASAPTSIPYKSSLVSEEVDFPRGGGSTLTPLEFKEATNEARREADADALVEVSLVCVSLAPS
jgi:rRNA biogenesis protein RRP5